MRNEARGDAETRGSGRVAQNLRDHTIQRIFAVGIGLTALARRLDEPEVQHLLKEYADDLDVAISAIYAAVFELTQNESDQDDSYGA